MAGFVIPEPFSPPVRRYRSSSEMKLVEMFENNNLNSIYKAYLNKFPDSGT
jgi:hypothetical protein